MNREAFNIFVHEYYQSFLANIFPILVLPHLPHAIRKEARYPALLIGHAWGFFFSQSVHSPSHFLQVPSHAADNDGLVAAPTVGTFYHHIMLYHLPTFTAQQMTGGQATPRATPLLNIHEAANQKHAYFKQHVQSCVRYRHDLS